MDSRFSKETLRKDLDGPEHRAVGSSFAERAGRVTCAEARFEVDQTVQRATLLAHLTRDSAE
jgi:hypothetical protein